MAAAARGSGRASSRPGCFCPAGSSAVGLGRGPGCTRRSPQPPEQGTAGARPGQLQPQPAAVQGPEPARVEVKGTAREGEAAELAAPQYQARRRRSAALDSGLPARGGGPRPRLPGVEDRGVCPPGWGPGLARLLMGEGRAELGGHCKPLVREMQMLLRKGAPC